MRSLTALGRLVWRSDIWLRIAILASVLLAPLIAVSLTVSNGPHRHAVAAGGRPALLWALWIATAVIPFIAAGAASFAVRDLLSKPFAWTLPSAYTLVLRGLMLQGLVVAYCIGLVHVYVEGLAAAVLAFALSLLAYSTWIIGMWAVQLHPAIPKKIGSTGPMLCFLALPPVIGIGFAAPTVLAHWLAAARSPWTIGLAVLVSAALVVRGLRPVPTVRAMHAAVRAWAYGDLARGGGGLGVSSSFARDAWTPSFVHRPWRHSLARGRTIDWLRAVLYETSGARRWGVLLPTIGFGAVSSYFACTMAVAHSLYAVFMGTLFIYSPIVNSPIVNRPPEGGLLYPIARAQRARVELWSGAVQGVFQWLLLAALISLFYRIVPHLPASTGQHGGGPLPATPSTILLAAGVAVAVQPLARWAVTLGRRPDAFVPPVAYRVSLLTRVRNIVVSMLLPMGAPLAFAYWTTRLAVVSGAAIVATLALATHGLYWLALRRALTVKDLA